ncbi:MAG: chromate transporter [Candidatus Cryptobacteroides sp.]
MEQQAESTRNEASLLQLFGVFAKIGAFTIGGGYAMISLIQNEIVNRKWLTDDEFTELITLAQAAPGLIAVNMSIFTGFRLRGVKGSIVATIGSILPPFLIILAVAMLFSNFQDNPIVLRIFKGIRPVVVALILVPMVNMVRKSDDRWWKWLLTAIALCSVSFLNVNPVLVILAVIILFLVIAVVNDRKLKNKDL